MEYTFLFELAIIQYNFQKVLKPTQMKPAYVMNQQFNQFVLSDNHPMRPMRLTMVNSLVSHYNLNQGLEIYNCRKATTEELSQYHHPDYIEYLSTWVNPKTTNIVQKYSPTFIQQQQHYLQLDESLGKKFNVNQTFDCPGFQGLFNYSQLAAGSSLDAADLIITGQTNIAINWIGGYHHAHAGQASGFCYVNDIVLCILELLKFYQKVLYLDIDVHHGDGVEHAFQHTNRVMTVSFHLYQEGFFPHTGAIEQIGKGEGKYFSVNVPLKGGIDDFSYTTLFKSVMKEAYDSFRPDVIVVQCGADSLSKDQIGQFNLSIRGHGECLQFMKSLDCPMILLGGGGYTIENASRCWAYETSLMANRQVFNNLPVSDPYFYRYHKNGDCGQLHFNVAENINNDNSPEGLQQIKSTIIQNLKHVRSSSSSVGFHHPPPRNNASKDRRQNMMDIEQYQKRKQYRQE